MAAESAAPAQAGASAAPASESVRQGGSSIHERIKASLFGSRSNASEASPREESDQRSSGNRKASSGVAPERASSADEQVPNEAADTEEVESPTEDQANAEADETDADDAQSEEAQPRTLKELADAIGWDIDRMSDLELPVKIDGKEGTARLRDLVKSYQLDGHINQKLASFDNDRKAWETKRAEGERALVDRLVQLDAGVQTLEKALEAEFHGVDWQKLASENPNDYASRWMAYNERYASLNKIATMLGQERQKFQEAQRAKAEEFLKEQKTLAEAKLPEYADAAKRAKFKGDAVEYFKEYGLTQQEFESISDHRQLLVVRDAVKWHQLQKAKPATLNKVKAAPKLLKPGSQQSRAVVEGLAAKREKDTLRQTGRARDAVPILKRQLFGNAR